MTAWTGDQGRRVPRGPPHLTEKAVRLGEARQGGRLSASLDSTWPIPLGTGSLALGPHFSLVQALTLQGPEGSFRNKGRACSSGRASAWVWKKSRRSVHGPLPAPPGPTHPVSMATGLRQPLPHWPAPAQAEATRCLLVPLECPSERGWRRRLLGDRPALLPPRADR